MNSKMNIKNKIYCILDISLFYSNLYFNKYFSFKMVVYSKRFHSIFFILTNSFMITKLTLRYLNNIQLFLYINTKLNQFFY